MKINKKAISLSLLSIIVAFGVETTNMFSYAAKDKNSVIEEVNTLKLQDILEDEKLINIKQINIDSNGNPSSAKDINLETKNLNLSDGTYALDYGDGWVKGLDAGIIGTLIVPSEGKGIFSRSHVERFSNKILVQTSASFTEKFITATIKAGYGYKWTESVSSKIDKLIEAPKGKNVFVKVQSVFRKIDIIKVKNGTITDKAETFKPTSYTFKSLEYNEGGQAIQSKLYERDTHNILGDSGYDISGIIDTEAKYVGYVNFGDKAEDYWTTSRGYYVNDAVGIYFTVPRDGKYELKELIYPNTYIGVNKVFYGTQKKLYKVDANNDSKVTLIGSADYDVKYENKNYEYVFPGNSVVADLKANEKYLIVFNSDRSQKLPGYSYVGYRLRVKRL